MGEANYRIRIFLQNCCKKRGFKKDEPSPRVCSMVPAVEIGIMNVQRGNNQMHPSLSPGSCSVRSSLASSHTQCKNLFERYQGNRKTADSVWRLLYIITQAKTMLKKH